LESRSVVPHRRLSGNTPASRSGGVAPVGHPQPIRTIVDRTLDDFDQLWAAGGIPHAVFPLTYDELIKLTGGMQADVS
jgi:prolyl-tRNA editing enzyme YbaK/EbsC (Cys-tRNA(Pro) deacylase)